MLEEILRELHSELPSNVALVAVSKFHPLEAIEEAYDAGQRIFAESRPQELLQKVRELDGRKPDIRWHFIGHLQTNKLKMVLPYVELVQSVDSVHLLDAIRKWGEEHGCRVKVLLEYHAAAEESKHGLTREEVLEVMEKYAQSAACDHVEICGLMGMATFTESEETVRSDFAKISSLFREVKDRFPELEEFHELSIGMSGDYRLALEYGSTMVRIGTKIFGRRVY